MLRVRTTGYAAFKAAYAQLNGNKVTDLVFYVHAAPGLLSVHAVFDPPSTVDLFLQDTITDEQLLADFPDAMLVEEVAIF